jgi:ABC-type bacteriocin/lantibiotic exporter with double-glycine peptidase domain
LLRVCRVAHVSEFLTRLPHGLDTRLVPGGTTLSAGQRQRLALARALLARPHILLLDEPTAALDEESEALIIEAVRGLRGSCTVVVVTHSPRMMAAADRVLHLTRRGLASATAADGALLVTTAR